MVRRRRGDNDHIQGLVARAGATRPPPSQARQFGQQSVLVFWGEWRKTLDIYDGRGTEIGQAIKIDDRYRETGYRYHYELRDAELRCVLRDTTRRRFGLDSWTYSFLVLGADGGELGTITQSGTSKESVIASDGQSVAAFGGVPRLEVMRSRPSTARRPTLFGRAQSLLDAVASKVWRVEDEPGHSVARITYMPGRGVAYVLEIEPRLDEPLRTMVLTIPIVADNRIIDLRGGGGG